MKSLTAFFRNTRDVFLKEIDLPDPRHNEIQAKTLYNGICMAEVYKYTSLCFSEPMLPGHEGIGIVTKVGSEVKGIREGDLVTTTTWGEYVNIPEGKFIPVHPQKDCDLKYHLVEPASCAVTAADEIGIYPGDSVILFGPGYMGLLLVQMLSKYPIDRLVVVGRSNEKLLLAKEYGATEVINSATEDGKSRIEQLMSSPFEIAFECSGAAEPLSSCEKLLGKGGKLGVYAWHHGQRISDGHLWHTKGLTLLNVNHWLVHKEIEMNPFKAADIMMSNGVVNQTKLVNREYKFEDIVLAMRESCERKDNFIKSVIKF